MSLLVKKALSVLVGEAGEHGLKRALGPGALVALGIDAVQ